MTDAVAEQITRSVYTLRQFTLGKPRDEAIAFWNEPDSQTGKPWRGELVIHDDETFTVMDRSMATLGVHFVCKSPIAGDDTVKGACCQLPEPFGNISLKFNNETMKFFLACPKERLNRKEKRMCQIFSERCDIDLGHEFFDDPSALPDVPKSVHLTAATNFALAIVAMADGEIEHREQELLLSYMSEVVIDGKSPEELKQTLQKIFDFIEDNGVLSSIDFVKKQFIGNPAIVPKVHAEMLVRLCIGMLLTRDSCSVDECEAVFFIGSHALGLAGGADVGRLFNVIAMEHEMSGQDVSQLRAAMSELTRRLRNDG